MSATHTDPPPSATLAAVAEKTSDNPSGVGRNPRAGEAAEQRITIRVTAAERATFAEAARKAGRSLADWLRDQARRAVSGKLAARERKARK